MSRFALLDFRELPFFPAFPLWTLWWLVRNCNMHFVMSCILSCSLEACLLEVQSVSALLLSVTCWFANFSRICERLFPLGSYVYFCSFVTFDVFHAGSYGTCPTLCPLQFLLVALLIGTHKCQPQTNFDSLNEIFDLQRDLHTNDFALCEAFFFGVRAFLFAFLL